MSRQRLLWINHFAVTSREAGGTRHAELSRELVKCGWDVTVAASDFNLQSRRYTRRPNVATRDVIAEIVDGVHFAWLLATPYETNNWLRGMNWLTFACAVREWARTQPPFDVVIGSSPHLFAAWAGLRIARHQKVPFVLEVRDLWPESLLAGGGRRGPLYVALDALSRHLYRAADRILVLARGNADYLIQQRRVPARRIAYIPNGADLSGFPAAGTRPTQPFTVVYAGAHGPANGLGAVLDAAERLRGENVRFLLVGDGPAKPLLVQDVIRRGLTNVEFRAPVPKKEMAAVFAKSSAGLMVLRESSLFAFGVSPNKLFDYMAASLPVVCNVSGDVAAMVAEAGAGEQAADASADALADAIRRLRRRSSVELSAMGASGRAWVEREHSRSRLAHRLDAVLRELTGS